MANKTPPRSTNNPEVSDNKQVRRELVKLPVESFMKTYLPFEPAEDVIQRIVQHLISETSASALPEDESLGKDEEDEASGQDEDEASGEDEDEASGEDEEEASGENKDEPSREDDLAAHDRLFKAVRAGTSLMLRHDEKEIFRAFPQAPTSANGTEKAVYAPLEEITEQISQIQGLVPGRQRNKYHYRDVSSKMIYSEIDGSNSKVDAVFMCGNQSSKPATHDIAVVIEQKFRRSQRGGNNRQAVSANVQIMNDDVRRMFTYGITIESDQVTLWCHSRSHSAVSEQFSFVHEPKLLLKVFTSFLYATKSELGYDPLVEHLGKGHYIFRGIPNAHDRSILDTYKSIGSISEIRANNISGRMARIFTVVKCNPQTGRFGTKKYVLKDVWIDESSQTEGEIQNAIFQDIDTFWANSETPSYMSEIKERHQNLMPSKDYKKHFLSIESDLNGERTKPVADGFQPIRGLLEGPLLEEEKVASVACAARIPAQPKNATHTIPETMAYTNFSRQNFECTYTRKKRYRVVFNELCTTVGHLDTLGEVIDVLYQCLAPLELIFCAGWVHRDISSGNIMAYRKNLEDKEQAWTTILADLEYAKKYPPLETYSAASDPKTGTPFFMPLEIMMHETLYTEAFGAFLAISANTTASTDENTVAKENMFEQAGKEDLANNTDPNSDLQLGLVHNFQHDLESIWWLILWNITSRVGGRSAQDLEYGQEIFQNTIVPSLERQKAFKSSIKGKLQTHLGTLAESFSGSMEKMRSAMYNGYIRREGQSSFTQKSSFLPIFTSFRSFFKEIIDCRAQWESTHLASKNPYIDPAERKRPFSEDHDKIEHDVNDTARKSKQRKRGASRKGNQPTK